jgi:hypothetical protein
LLTDGEIKKKTRSRRRIRKITFQQSPNYSTNLKIMYKIIQMGG